MSPDPDDRATPSLFSRPSEARPSTGQQGERLAASLEGMDTEALQGELAQAMSVVADAQGDYADAVQSKLDAMDAQDEPALQRAKELAGARLALVHEAEARASAVRSALRAIREAQRANPGGEAADRFVDVEDFVAHFLSPTIQRKMGGGAVWCCRWWAHPEAANRLWAMWRGYESARLQAGGSLSRWWVNQVDPHLEVLLDDRGPFSECRKGNHRLSSGLPVERAPVGWWTVRTGDFDTAVVCEPTSSDDTDEEEEGTTT